MNENTGIEYVDVVFVQDWDEFEGDAPEWGDWQAMAEYLTQWDYGTETDDAHTRVDDNGRRGAGTDDMIVATVNDGDIEYRLTVNLGLRYASLTREPLTRFCTNHDDPCPLPCPGCEADCPPEMGL